MSDYSTPYDENEEDREGRVAIQSTHIDFYNTSTSDNPGGIDPSVPYPDEISHDSDGHSYILTRDPDTNQVIPKSGSKALREEFDLLKSRGIFDNAEAFVFNRQINILYFDNDRLTVKSRDVRTFNPAYKYYAIRGFRVGNNDPVYFTGIEASDGSGNIISNLVDMKLGTDVDGNPCTIIQTGKLIQPLVHGYNYMVEFYDADGIIQDIMAFQAYAVRHMPYDSTPDLAVVDLAITANSQVSGQPWACQLYRGQTYDDLALRVYLKYADGDTRDVTYEQGSGASNRLHINGIEAINTDTPTPEEGTPQTFSITYYLSQASVDNPLVNPENLSITREVKVYILPDQNDEPLTLVLGLWQTTSLGVKKTLMKVFSLNAVGINKESTVLRDITYRMRSAVIENFTFVEDPIYPDRSRFESNGTESGLSELAITVPYATSMNKTFSVSLQTESGTSETRVKYLIGTGNMADVKIDTIKRVITAVDPGINHFLTFDNINNPEYTIENFRNKYRYVTDGGVITVPTHFAIKSARNPLYYHTDRVPLENMHINIPYASEDEAGSLMDISDKTPLIVEFYNITVNGENEIVSSFVTGAGLFYVNAAI